MNITGFTVGHGLMLTSPCLGKDAASDVVSGSIAPRDTGLTTF